MISSATSKTNYASVIAGLMVGFAPLIASAAGPALPDAGAILQQLAPLLPPALSSSQGALTINQTSGNEMPTSLPILVQRFEITGNTRIDTSTLLAQVEKFQGKSLTLSELAEVATLITTYYRSHDFPLARAIIPPQTIAQGVVRIEVIEALYGQIILDNSSEVSDVLLQKTLAQLQSGQAINQTEMDRVLLRLSDVPGVVVEATLKPGNVIGSSDLVVSTLPGPSAYGAVTLDNYGNRYTGRERLSGEFSVLNMLHHGDILSLNALSSGRGMNSGRLGYESLINGVGTRIGAATSTLNYVLGKPITTDIHGTAQVDSLLVKQSLVRGRGANVNGQVQYDALKLRDFYSDSIQANRSLRNLTISLSGDIRDQWLAGGGVNAWSLNWTSGKVAFDNSAAQRADAATANTQGGFSKLNASFVRLQSLTPEALLYLTAAAQWSHTNLDSSQRMSVGGPYTVRAYDVGAASGDKGYFLSAEYRYNLRQDLAGQLQAVAFIESARVIVNARTWPGLNGENSGNLNGAGVGLNWNELGQWSLKAYIAKPIGAVPLIVGNSNSVRVWLGLVRKL